MKMPDKGRRQIRPRRPRGYPTGLLRMARAHLIRPPRSYLPSPFVGHLVMINRGREIADRYCDVAA